MNSRVIAMLGLLATLHMVHAESAPGKRQHVFHHENVLGTSLELKVTCTCADTATRAEAAALAEIDRLAGILSTWDPDSGMSRWQHTRGKPVKVAPEMIEILGLFDQWRARTGGALDPAAESVCRTWRDAAAGHRLPTSAELATAMATIGQRHWSLDTASGTATHLTDAPLVFHSFTKSYIASRACDAAFRVDGINAMVVNIGGDLVARGELTETVQLADPRADAENDPPLASIRVRDRTVATSGNYRRGEEINGKWFSHIVDPRSGQPVDHVISATVVAPEATDAGALATACCVLQPAESLQLVATMPDAECLLVTKDGRHIASAGWSRMVAPAAGAARMANARQPFQFINTPDATSPPATGTPASTPVPAAASGAMWNPLDEVLVTLELSRFDGRRAARPFVAVWIEDHDKYPVRTLALWYNGARWLPDLRGWSHGEQLRAMAEGNDLIKSVSSATRAPGKYTLKWDGKDNTGKPVKAGKYTVWIEAAREHGTYQIMRQEIDCGGTAAKIDIPGNAEISAASLDYHRKADGN